MRIWIIAIPCAYLALLLVLAAPLIEAAFSVDYLAPEVGAQLVDVVVHLDWGIPLELMFSPWTCLWLGALVGAQLALLLPCGNPSGRPRARRRLFWSLIAAAFLAGLLFACLAVALLFGIGGDELFDILDNATAQPIFDAFGGGEWLIWIIMILSPIVTAWALWWWILLKATSGRPSPRFPEKAARWLLAGSVLEFIVAVPCHVAARNRDDCCAPFATFFGMATGIAVALLCCGPALVYLVRDRLRRKRPRAQPHTVDNVV